VSYVGTKKYSITGYVTIISNLILAVYCYYNTVDQSFIMYRIMVVKLKICQKGLGILYLWPSCDNHFEFGLSIQCCSCQSHTITNNRQQARYWK